MPLDPGVAEQKFGWSTHGSGDRGLVYGNFDSVAPGIPLGFKVHVPWSVPGNSDVRNKKHINICLLLHKFRFTFCVFKLYCIVFVLFYADDE